MRNFRLSASVIVFLLTFIAVNDTLLTPLGISAQSTSRIALFVVVDSSGSMNDNDRDNRRWTAVKLLVGLLSKGDKLAVISFGSAAETFPTVLNKPYGPLITIDDDGRAGTVTKETILKDLDAFAAQVQRGTTNMSAAFDALTPLVKNPGLGSDTRPYIVFLTDGIADDTPTNRISNLTKQVEQLGAPLYAGGLFVNQCPRQSVSQLNPTSEASKGMTLLTSLGDISGGQSTCVNNVDQLPEFFLQSFGNLAYRSYQRPTNGRFEVTGDQEELIASATLVYVNNAGRCQATPGAPLCVSITNPSLQQITVESLRNQPGIQFLSDPNFLALTINEPSGAWQLADPQNWHIIVRTNIRMDVGAPSVDASFTRQPLGQPIPVQVQFRTEVGGQEQIRVPSQEPIFTTHIQPKEPDSSATSFDLERVGSSFIGQAQRQNTSGRYVIGVEARIAGFTFRDTQEINIEPFPGFRISGLPGDQLVIPRDGDGVIRLESVLDNQPEAVDGLDSQAVQLICNGRLIPTTLTPAGVAAINLTFNPPSEAKSDCRIDVSSQLEHRGAPYTLNPPTVATFEVLVQPVLHLSNLSHDLNALLPFSVQTLPGPIAKLAADGNAELSAEIKAGQYSDQFTAVVKPRTLLNNQETPLEIELRQREGSKLPYGSYEVVVVVKPSLSLSMPEGNELRYSFELVQPQIEHSFPATYSLSEPFARWDEQVLTIPFQINTTLPFTTTLQMRSAAVSQGSAQGQIDLQSNVVATDTLPPLELPLQGERTLKVQLFPHNNIDPFPQWWISNRPISIDMEIGAEDDIRVLPRPSIRINGIRLSVLHMILRDYATQIEQVRMSILVVSFVWGLFLIGWLYITKRSYSLPKEYLFPTYLNESAAIRNYLDSPTALSNFSKLKHQVFGIRLTSQATQTRRVWLPRSLKPADVWYWVLGAHRTDIEVPSLQTLDVIITSRNVDGAIDYQIKNMNTEPLRLLVEGQPINLHSDEQRSLRPRDVILTSEQNGLEFNGYTTSMPETSSPPIIKATGRRDLNQAESTSIERRSIGRRDSQSSTPSVPNRSINQPSSQPTRTSPGRRTTSSTDQPPVTGSRRRRS